MNTTGIDDTDRLIIIGGTILLVGSVVWSIIQGIMGTFGITYDQFITGLWGAAIGGILAGGVWYGRNGTLHGIVGGIIAGATTASIGWILLTNTGFSALISFVGGFGLAMAAIYAVIYVVKVVASLLAIWLDSRKNDQHQTNTSSHNRRQRKSQSSESSEPKRTRTRYRQRERNRNSRY
jgi:hypothetical protein